MAKKKTTRAATGTPRRKTAAAPAARSAAAGGKKQAVPKTAKKPSRPAETEVEPSVEDIAVAAYHRYLSRGAGDGRAFDDWIDAERELRRRSRLKP